MLTSDRLQLPAVKRCTKCGLLKHIEDFAHRSDRPCGRKSLCLVCDRVKARRYYAAKTGRRVMFVGTLQKCETMDSQKGSTDGDDD